MFSPILRSNLTVYTALVQRTDLLLTGETSPETCRADLKRSIKGNFCILLVTYIVILTTHGHTNIKFKNLAFI
jgi:hypothetical protein